MAEISAFSLLSVFTKPCTTEKKVFVMSSVKHYDVFAKTL
jgi:hypothetical protein